MFDNELDDQEGDGMGAQGAQSATIDPMTMIKQAAGFGRKKFGLPANFTTGQDDEQSVASFADGGVIPDGQPQGDVTAGGNSGMSDPRQTMRYLAGDGAVSSEIASALEQHVDPQGQMDPAQRTLAAISAAPNDEAKFGMMQHYRTRYNAHSGAARAAMDRGDMGQAAQSATQAMASVPTGSQLQFAPAGSGGIAVLKRQAKDNAQQPSYADGGVVDDYALDPIGEDEPYDDTPTNDATRRQYEDAGGSTPQQWLKHNEQEIESQGAAADGRSESVPRVPRAQEVNQPTVLTPDQFKKLMTAGYDKPIDDGWEGLINSIMGALGPSSAEAAPLQQQGGTTTVPKTKGDRQPISPALQRQMDTPSPLSQVTQAQTAAKPEEDRQKKYQQALERAQSTAQKIFPMASQEPQRANYVQHAMQSLDNTEGKVEIENAKGRGNIANTREQNKLTIEREKEAGRMQRQGNAAHSREDIARMNNQYRTFNAAQREQVRLLGQQLAADPSLAKDPTKAMARVQQLSQSLNIDPKDLMAIIENGGTPPQGAAQQQPQAPAGAKPTVVVFPNGPFAGKPMIRQPNGSYVPAPR